MGIPRHRRKESGEQAQLPSLGEGFSGLAATLAQKG
jgi:hypothetical protein